MEVPNEFERIVLLSDHASVPLADEVYKYLSAKQLYGKLHKFNPDDIYLNRYNDRECEVKLKTAVRGRHILVVKSFNTMQNRVPYDYKTKSWEKKPQLSDFSEFEPNNGYIELFAINDALKMSAASSITNIMMFMPYLRQDKKDSSGVPITAKLMAKLTEASGASRIITIDPHFPQVQGFYNIHMDILTSRVLFADWLSRSYSKEELVLIAPDANAAHSVEKLANDLQIEFGVAHKSRSAPGRVKETRIIYSGSLENKVVAICDDLIDTGSSVINCGNYAKQNGAKKVIACIAHPVLSCNAKQALLENKIDLITTDSVIIPDKEKYSNITVLSLGHLISEAIGCITSGEPIHNHLYDFEEFQKVKKANGL